MHSYASFEHVILIVSARILMTYLPKGALKGKKMAAF